MCVFGSNFASFLRFCSLNSDVDVYKICSHWSMDLISKAGFGKNSNALKDFDRKEPNQFIEKTEAVGISMEISQKFRFLMCFVF